MFLLLLIISIIILAIGIFLYSCTRLYDNCVGMRVPIEDPETHQFIKLTFKQKYINKKLDIGGHLSNLAQEWLYQTLNSIGAIFLFISVIVCIIFTGMIVKYNKVYTKQLAIYEEENAKIEKVIDDTIANYKEYEGSTYKDFKLDESADITVKVNTYPELKSNELVVKQLEIYQKNNETIKQLKADIAEVSLFKWLLYFGN